MNQVNVDFFKDNGYCIVRNSISSELRDFVTQYALFDEMQDFSPDVSQVKGAHSKYADPAMETLLLQLCSLMEENTGLELYPTYSFYRVYRPGDELVKHKDRPSCEISCTLCFNFEYKDANYDWPIFMNENKVSLAPGDLVIYRGCDLNHWREQFVGSNSCWHVQGFFHYVDKNGPNSSWQYDRRNSVGEISKPTKSTTLLSQKSYISSTE
jgi:hypothetical protein